MGDDWLRGQNAHGRLLVRLRELRQEYGADWAYAVEAPPASLGLRLLGRELGAFVGRDSPPAPCEASPGHGPLSPDGSTSPFVAAGRLLAAA